jgi:hypothetical protein
MKKGKFREKIKFELGINEKMCEAKNSSNPLKHRATPSVGFGLFEYPSIDW